MKKATALVALSLFVGASALAGNIKESSVPAVVKAYVVKNYPQATEVEWDYEEKGNFYSAEFKIDGADHDLDISPEGKLIHSEIEIDASLLPKEVHAYLAEQYPGFRIKEVEKQTHRGTDYYVVKIKGQHSDQKLTFTENGTLVGKKL